MIVDYVFKSVTFNNSRNVTSLVKHVLMMLHYLFEHFINLLSYNRVFQCVTQDTYGIKNLMNI